MFYFHDILNVVKTDLTIGFSWGFVHHIHQIYAEDSFKPLEIRLPWLFMKHTWRPMRIFRMQLRLVS